jgi:hypothetical protein
MWVTREPNRIENYPSYRPTDKDCKYQVWMDRKCPTQQLSFDGGYIGDKLAFEVAPEVFHALSKVRLHPGGGPVSMPISFDRYQGAM